MFTESPSRSSEASAVRTRSRAPSALRSRLSTSPRSRTIPVNISPSPLPQPSADQEVVAGALPVHRQRSLGGLDASGALARHQGPRPGAAEHDRRDEQPQLVDLAAIEEGARQARAALQQQRGDVAATQ